MGDVADEEDGEGGVEDHLEEGVYGDEDGAVVAVAAGEAGPDEDLRGGWVGFEVGGWMVGRSLGAVGLRLRECLPWRYIWQGLLGSGHRGGRSCRVERPMIDRADIEISASMFLHVC